MPKPGLHENGFGSTWLGNLVLKLDGDWAKIRCRGYWEDLRAEEDCIRFYTETAWCECSDLRHMLEEKFEVDVFFISEECGMGIYEKNDPDGSYFPENYHIWIEDKDDEYFEDITELCDYVQEYLGTDQELNTLKDCNDALEEHSEETGVCFSLAECEIVDN